MESLGSILIPWVASTAGLFALIHWDEKRLRGVEAARAWPATSRQAAIVVFGILSLPVHFWRTRRGIRGISLGLGWFLLGVVANILLGSFFGD